MIAIKKICANVKFISLAIVVLALSHLAVSIAFLGIGYALIK